MLRPLEKDKGGVADGVLAGSRRAGHCKSVPSSRLRLEKGGKGSQEKRLAERGRDAFLQFDALSRKRAAAVAIDVAGLVSHLAEEGGPEKVTSRRKYKKEKEKNDLRGIFREQVSLTSNWRYFKGAHGGGIKHG